MPHPLIFPELFDAIQVGSHQPGCLFLVGGAVRDALLQRHAHDLDFCMAGDPKPTARRVADTLKAAFYVMDDERGTARVIYTDPHGVRYSIDFAAFRGADLEADLRGRDFTVNAMAVDAAASQTLIDPLGGAADLRAGRLRACSPTSLLDDPLRILRGVRLAVAYGFQIEAETRQGMRASVEGLARVSAERKRDELFRILDGPQPTAAIRALDALGALAVLLPDMENLKGVMQSPPHTLDVWEHTLAVAGQLDTLLDVLTSDPDPGAHANLFMGQASLRLGRYRAQFKTHLANQINPNRGLRGLLMLAALYHDAAKPVTHEVDRHGRIRNLAHEKVGAEAAARRAQQLSLTNAEVDRLRDLIRYHMRIHSLAQTGEPPSRRAIYRFFRDAGDAGVDLCLLALADVLGTYGPTLPPDTWAHYLDICRELLESYWDRSTETINPPALVDGHVLQETLKFAPGPRLGLALEAVREAQVMGQVNNREEALGFVREWLKRGVQKHGN